MNSSKQQNIIRDFNNNNSKSQFEIEKKEIKKLYFCFFNYFVLGRGKWRYRFMSKDSSQRRKECR